MVRIPVDNIYDILYATYYDHFFLFFSVAIDYLHKRISIIFLNNS